ncbi:MAG TPA: hypothetical protein VHL80_18530 [Polyangia bacterium]|nr:hypothetical protein [Polyangia bacterium]
MLVCLLSPAARAAGLTIALLPPTGDNVAPQILSASRDLLKDHLLRTGAYNVVEPPPSNEPGAWTVEPTAAQAAATAVALGAAQAVAVRLTHIGTAARVRLTVYAAGSGQILYWDSLAVTGGPEELDTVFQRLAHAMETGKPVRESAEIDTVTDKEMQTLGRRQANRTFGVHLLSLFPFNTAGSFKPLPGGGLFWLYDARTWMADFAFDAGGGDGQSMWSAAIGGYYPVLREDFTPYFGGLVRWAYMDLGGNGASGLSLQPTAGILLGRLSSVQLRADVGWFFNTFGEYGTATVIGAQGQTTMTTASKHFANGVVLTVGIGF